MKKMLFSWLWLLPALSWAAGIWTATGSMSTVRYAYTATLLPNGKVLVAGGYHNFASAEVYNPSSGTWSNTGAMSTARHSYTATLLPNGKVLVAGGYNVNGSVANAELYDPSSGTWSNTGIMSTARGKHTASLLPDGKVLVAGGGYKDSNDFVIASAEVYDPSSGTWSNTGSMSTVRYQHTATLLSNGKVLVAGGYNNTSAEVYDPSSGTWSNTGSMSTARYQHTATLLPNGKVLVAGGWSYVTSAEVYDPSNGTWSNTGTMSTARLLYTATLLPNGKVLVAGGYNGSYNVASAEVYDPSSGTWSNTGAMSTARREHTATLLPNGKVLVAGGYYNITSAELYDPGSLILLPAVSTNSPSVITSTNATLQGTVNPNGATTSVTFDFGTTTAYGTNITATPASIAATAGATAVSTAKTGLTCGTAYHYRVKAVNSTGTSNGVDKTFVTTACNYTVTPSAGTGGTVNPNTAQTVTGGNKATFTVTPNSGYNRNNVVGGTCPQGTWNGNVWTTGAIVASCTVNFSFTLIPVLINGVCGSSNGGTFSVAPTTNLCSTGTVSGFSGSGPWNWSCAGSNGGTTASCSANLQTAVINSWLYPASLKTPRDKPFTLEVTAKSDGMQIITYSFTITFDAKLMLDPAFYAAPCNQGICPGNNALTENAITVDNRTGAINVTGVGGMTAAGNDLQLLVIHFKSLAVLGASIVDLKTNVLMSNAGNIGLGARGSTVNISTGICGDANGDTVVNIIDALAIARKVVGLPPPPTIEPLWADVDYDSRASIVDALQIARYSVGLLTPPEVCVIGMAF